MKHSISSRLNPYMCTVILLCNNNVIEINTEIIETQ